MTPSVTQNLDQPTFDPIIEADLVKIEKLREKSVYGNATKVRVLLDEAMSEIQKNPSAKLRKIENDRDDALTKRESATASWSRAKNALIEHGNDYQDPDFDARQFLSDYADGLSQYKAGCLPRMSGGKRLSDEEFNAQSTGANSCSTLGMLDGFIHDTLTKSFLESTASSSPNYFVFGGHFSVPNVRQFVELADYGTSYTLVSLHLGYFRDVSKNFPASLQESGPLLEVAGSYIGGDQSNRGSHRYQIGLQVGWEQRFFPKNLIAPYVSPKVGLGFSDNWMDFGKGYPLAREDSLMTHFEFNLGATLHCGASLCSFFAGAFYERTLLGMPKYETFGPVLGATANIGSVSRNRKE